VTLKTPANSFGLSCTSLAVVGLAYAGGWVNIWGSAASDLLMLAAPVLVLATIIYAPADFRRRSTRIQGIAALALTLPVVALFELWVREIVLL